MKCKASLETFPGRQSGTDWSRAGTSVTRWLDIPLASWTLDGESTDLLGAFWQEDVLYIIHREPVTFSLVHFWKGNISGGVCVFALYPLPVMNFS